MTKPLREDVARDPACVTEEIRFDGENVILRPLRRDDALALGRYFEGLSEATRARFGPHPFTMEEARKLCDEIDPSRLLRLVAVTGTGDQEAIIAYFILTLGIRNGELKRFLTHGLPLDPECGCTFAPSVSDAYQDRGLGSALMPFIVNLARNLGFQRMVLQGGTQEDNARGIHFYEKFGFRKVGEFTTRMNNFDMVLDLESRESG